MPLSLQGLKICGRASQLYLCRLLGAVQISQLLFRHSDLK